MMESGSFERVDIESMSVTVAIETLKGLGPKQVIIGIVTTVMPIYKRGLQWDHDCRCHDGNYNDYNDHDERIIPTTPPIIVRTVR